MGGKRVEEVGIGSAGMYVMKWLGFISLFPTLV